MFIRTGALAGVLALAGCEGANTPDANPQVFQTIQSVADQRRIQQQAVWKDVAVDALKVDRPDLQATPGEEFSVTLSADGVTRVVDLTPAWDLLVAQPERATQILRNQLTTELPAFDQQRMMALTPERVRGMVRPMLLTGREADDFSRSAAAASEGDAVPRTVVSADLYWAPAIRWEAGTKTPVSQNALRTWKLERAEVEAAAMANLKNEVASKGAEWFETTRFGPTGQVGTLKPGAEPAVILLPEFLATVRRAWNTSDSLAILLATRDNVRFAESGNTVLLDMLYPAWKEQTDANPNALSRRVLLLSDQGLGVFADYRPPVRINVVTTQPVGGMGVPGAAQRPGMAQPRLGPQLGPATRPAMPNRPGQQPGQRPYIVR